jgi:outer membrane protein insertion porin family
MSVKPGEVYNETALSADLKRLFASQAYSDVRRVLTASADNPDHYNLTVEVDEKKTGAISLGGGVDTGTGLFGSLGYSDPNFLGRGQNFSSAFSVGSGVIQRDRTSIANTRVFQFEVGWTNPSVNDSLNSLSVNAYGRNLASFNVPLGIERRIGSEISISRPLLSFKNMSGSLSLRGENVSIREGASQRNLDRFDISDADRRKMLEGGTYLTLSPTVAYDTRDNRMDPTSGWYNTMSLTGAMGLGSPSYGAITANVRKYYKIRDGVTLALNSQVGKSLLGSMPEFNAYRLGGTYSVRGFQEGGLGTGSGFMMASAELRTKLPFVDRLTKVPVLNSLTGALFADAGSVFDETLGSRAFDRPGFGASVGLGLRLNIPALGPLRLDYAIPVTSANDNFIRPFSFGIGQKF